MKKAEIKKAIKREYIQKMKEALNLCDGHIPAKTLTLFKMQDMEEEKSEDPSWIDNGVYDYFDAEEYFLPYEED